MAKITFIEARSPDFHVFKKYGLPRLGNLSMGTMLEQAGHDVKVYVEDICDVDWIDALDSDVVGVSTLTNNAPRAYEIARQCKERGIPVMMGGPHVTFEDEEALNYCDYVIRGEGEVMIEELVDNILHGRGFETIDGLSYKVDGQVVRNGGLPRVPDMDVLPIPNFDLVQEIKGKNFVRQAMHPMQTSRGCPFDCNFCSVTATFGQKFRYRSIDNVLEELAQVDPSQLIFFYDDIFTANKKRTKQLLTRMIEEGITPKWTAQVRADSARDPEMLDLFEASNCYYVYIGFESINPATLNEYNKSQRVEDIERAIKEYHKRNVKIHGMFIFGSDYDDVNTIRNTVKFAKKQDIDTVQFMILVPLPGTHQYRQMREEGRIFIDDWAFYDAHHVVYQPAKMSVFELQKESLVALTQFYDSWQVIKRLLKGDILAVILKAYGWRMSRQWAKSNQDFVTYARGLQKSASERIGEAGQRVDVIAKKTAEDIKEALEQLVQAGEIQPISA